MQLEKKKGWCLSLLQLHVLTVSNDLSFKHSYSTGNAIQVQLFSLSLHVTLSLP